MYIMLIFDENEPEFQNMVREAHLHLFRNTFLWRIHDRKNTRRGSNTEVFQKIGY